MWSRVSLVVVLSLLAQACTSDEPFPAPEAFEAPSIEEVESSIRAAGVNVVDSVEDHVDDPWLTITANQLASMSAEVSSRGGLTGRQLDGVMPPAPEGAPPFAFWVAAWLHDKPTERATTAARWYPEDTDWTRAPDLLFARATLFLFMADVAEDFDRNMPPLDPGETFEIMASLPAASQLMVSGIDMPLATDAGTACLVIADFFTNGIASLFNKLRLQQDWLGEGIFGFVGGLLATLWNTVLSLAQAAVEGLVRNLTEPVMRWVGQAIAIAGIVSHISSYVDGWNIELARDPASIHWGLPATTGLFRVQPATNHRPWDPSLRKCAQALNVTLPDLLSPGSRVEWTVDKPGLIIEERRDNIVPAGGRMPEYRYRVPNETHQPPHSGDLVTDDLLVTVRAPRSDLRNVLVMARNLLSGLVGGLVPAIPIVDLRSAVENGLNALIDPVLAEAERAITGVVAGERSVLVVDAMQLLLVSRHDPDPTTTTLPRPDPVSPVSPQPPFGGQEQPPCENGCGHSLGDPHLVTVDGHDYDFQAAGEFVLIRSEDRSVDIQVRYEPLEGVPDVDVSVATAVATELGDHRVGFYDLLGSVLVDGEPLLPGETADFGADGVVEAFPWGMWVEYQDGTQMYVVGPHITIAPSEDLKSGGAGLIGPVTPGGLAIPPLPDGSVLPDPGEDRELHFDLLYRRFRDAWRIPKGESLFQYEAGDGPETYNIDDFPDPQRVFLFLDDLPPEVQAQGVAACSGISDESMNERCAYDVAVTGDDSWADGYRSTDQLLVDGPSILFEDEGEQPAVTSRPVEGRAGVPTLQLRSDLSDPNVLANTGRLVAAEGTVLVAKARLCPVGANVELVLTPDSDDIADTTRVPLCQGAVTLAPLDDDDLYLPTESYALIGSGGVYEVALDMTGDPSAVIDVDIYVDPDPVIVRAADGDLSVFSDTHRLEHIADTVVYVFSHPGGIVAFSSSEGMAAGEACGNLEYGATSPGEPGGLNVWDLHFCAHTDAVYVGHLSGNLKIPMVVFNRTGDPVEVSLGPPD